MKRFCLVFTLLTCIAALPKANAFTPINATYTGLFFEPEGAWQQTSGTATITTTWRGKFTGRLQFGPSRYSFSGIFDSNGYGEAVILRRFAPSLSVALQVDAEDPDVINGTITDGTWTADLIADRQVFGKTYTSTDAGQYTLLIPGNFTSTSDPGGDGYGTITVDRYGRLRFSGSLADGTKITQSSTVSKGGQWPFYNSLYAGGGAIWGWMLFNKSPDEPLKGDLTWVRPQMNWTVYYREGFAITTSAWGSHYLRPPGGTKILNIGEGQMEFNGGNLGSTGFTNRVVIDSRNRVGNLSANKLTMSFSTSTGTFSGRAMVQGYWDWISFRGVVLQDFNVAGGYFLDWNRSGEAWLQEPPADGALTLK